MVIPSDCREAMLTKLHAGLSSRNIIDERSGENVCVVGGHNCC